MHFGPFKIHFFAGSSAIKLSKANKQTMNASILRYPLLDTYKNTSNTLMIPTLSLGQHLGWRKAIID
jgi:hypothetical protein